jgi:hypothetical protein
MVRWSDGLGGITRAKPVTGPTPFVRFYSHENDDNTRKTMQYFDNGKRSALFKVNRNK